MSDTPTHEALRQCRDALQYLANSADNVGFILFDQEGLPSEVALMQIDILRARAALAAADAALASPAGEPTVPSAAVLLAEQVLHMDMVTDRGLRARDLARQVLDNAHDIHEGECADVLRSIASYLGAGGYNATAVDAAVFREKIMWGIEQINGQQPTPAALSVPALVADKWEGAEEWMPLAWELCADECGEDACNELVWEGGPVPEPWGDRWLKYEGEAKRLIALVRKHVPGVAPPPPAPVPAVPPGWAFYTG